MSMRRETMRRAAAAGEDIGEAVEAFETGGLSLIPGFNHAGLAVTKSFGLTREHFKRTMAELSNSFRHRGERHHYMIDTDHTVEAVRANREKDGNQMTTKLANQMNNYTNFNLAQQFVSQTLASLTTVARDMRNDSEGQVDPATANKMSSLAADVRVITSINGKEAQTNFTLHTRGNVCTSARSMISDLAPFMVSGQIFALMALCAKSVTGVNNSFGALASSLGSMTDASELMYYSTLTSDPYFNVANVSYSVWAITKMYFANWMTGLTMLIMPPKTVSSGPAVIPLTPVILCNFNTSMGDPTGDTFNGGILTTSAPGVTTASYQSLQSPITVLPTPQNVMDSLNGLDGTPEIGALGEPAMLCTFTTPATPSFSSLPFPSGTPMAIVTGANMFTTNSTVGSYEQQAISGAFTAFKVNVNLLCSSTAYTSNPAGVYYPGYMSGGQFFSNGTCKNATVLTSVPVINNTVIFDCQISHPPGQIPALLFILILPSNNANQSTYDFGINATMVTTLTQSNSADLTATPNVSVGNVSYYDSAGVWQDADTTTSTITDFGLAVNPPNAYPYGTLYSVTQAIRNDVGYASSLGAVVIQQWLIANPTANYPALTSTQPSNVCQYVTALTFAQVTNLQNFSYAFEGSLLVMAAQQVTVPTS